MTDDDFKRASLRGRGWKILRGQEQPTDDFHEHPPSADEAGDISLTDEEAEEILAAGPPALGMLQPHTPEFPEVEPEHDLVYDESEQPVFAPSTAPVSEAFSSDEVDDFLAAGPPSIGMMQPHTPEFPDPLESSSSGPASDDELPLPDLDSYEFELLPTEDEPPATSDEGDTDVLSAFDPSAETAGDIKASGTVLDSYTTELNQVPPAAPDLEPRTESAAFDGLSSDDMQVPQPPEDVGFAPATDAPPEDVAFDAVSGPEHPPEDDFEPYTPTVESLFPEEPVTYEAANPESFGLTTGPGAEIDRPESAPPYEPAVESLFDDLEEPDEEPPYELHTTQPDEPITVDDEAEADLFDLPEFDDFAGSPDHPPDETYIAEPLPQSPTQKPPAFEPAYEDSFTKVQASAEPPETLEQSGEALPIGEDEQISRVDLRGQQRALPQPVQRLIPENPETATSSSEVPGRLPDEQLDVTPPIDEPLPPEGVGAMRGDTERMEAIPLVEDIDRPPIKALRGLSPQAKLEVDRHVIPRTPETRESAILTDFRGTHGDGTGGIYGLGEFVEADGTLKSPFGEPKPRQPAAELFLPTQPADPDLLGQFVDNKRLNDVWEMIEELQEAVAERAIVDHSRADIYQKELLRASDLLLQSRQNYDDARAIALRVRADLKRDRRIQEDINRWRPQIVWYITVWGIVLVILGLLSGFVNDFAEEILEMPFVGAAYLPSIFGAAGGLFFAYTTLNKHTSIQRDFDPIHVPWYMLAPLVGMLMGFMAFLIWAASVATTFDTDLTDPSPLVWLLAFAAGINQNWVINRLRTLRGSIGNQDDEDAEVKRT
ncbi:MAG: hypothetical protein GYB66_08180 [Chloroflexi bacterium]|nr:hypothetical protein [Chloroflexota bacterium]